MPIQQATSAPGSALAPFQYPAFRAIWTANLFSNIGSMIQSVGAAWLMTELTTSHVLVALVQASATIPILLLGVFAGAIADNFDRRRVMLAAQSGMLIVSAVLAGLSFTGNIGPYSLLALTLMVGMGTALNGPAWQASVRLQVGPKDLPQAISLNAISFNLARSVGPALGGILISLWSTSIAFGLNAVSYIGMIAVLAMWRPESLIPVREPMLAAIGRGLRFCAGSSPIRKVLMRGLMLGFGAAGLQALMPSIARDMLDGTELDYGLMLGGFGIGSILTAIGISKVRRRFGSEPVVTAATLIFIAAQLVMASANSIPMAIAAAFLGGMGWACAMTSLNVAMQLRSPEDILGRCLSIYQAITFGGMALGAWAWGTVADIASLPTALHAAALWLAASLAMHFIAPMPTREEGRLDAVPESKP
ncbi:MAG: arabinose ABC transporter permease [Novosphingobium sp. 16-62-11]|uniref:MFS transporter n=1 Tax=Novosphingobium sp. 17-62-19 TaxID=1970406 RepID=UPI000BC89E5C|nr:MFS transporter [Novosphingobium sp. 17-62-19]OYX91323.1 MAG: arabinose ABC transporter permease [Novosphingobium sp. 35-62-5]OYZ45583.1 MAG: arabinose ABC transporter permease [Novosphingobium sp. 16-62-11]OZA19387.1 MAG: arabinose ABC transporter permease [Novosphingobium sp. 17-62-19]HQS94958.1 MFS transporter [Novosphingobium sp.]